MFGTKTLTTAVTAGLIAYSPFAIAAGTDADTVHVGLLSISPYAYFDEVQEPVGLLVDFFDLIATEADLEIDVNPEPTPRLSRDIQSGAIGCTIYIRSSATEAVADPLVSLGLDFRSVVIPRRGIELKNYEDLKPISIAVGRGTVFGHKIDTDETLNKFISNDYFHSARLMKKNRVDAILGVEWSVLYNLQKAGVPPEEIGPPLVIGVNPLWVFCSRSSALSESVRSRIKAAVDVLRERGEFSVLLQRYLPEPVPEDAGAGQS